LEEMRKGAAFWNEQDTKVFCEICKEETDAGNRLDGCLSAQRQNPERICQEAFQVQMELAEVRVREMVGTEIFSWAWVGSQNRNFWGRREMVDKPHSGNV
jgi:hypothetical protein